LRKIKGEKPNCPQRLNARKGGNRPQDATNSEVRDRKPEKTERLTAVSALEAAIRVDLYILPFMEKANNRDFISALSWKE